MKAKNDTNVLLTDTESIPSPGHQLPTAEDQDWGVDTINLSFPVSVTTCDDSSSIWTKSSSLIDLETGQTYEGLTGFHSTPNGDVRINLSLTKERCYLQLNASRLVKGKSRLLLHPDALKPLIGGLLTDLQYVVTATFDIDPATGVLERQKDWAKQVRISRLDLARNLNAPHSINELKQALELAKPSYGKTHITYNNTKGGWTLVNGTASTGQDRIYDKTTELGNFDTEEQITQDTHWFRFETQLQKARLQRSGLTVLDKVNAPTAWQAINDRWEACRWGVTINEPGTIQKALAGLPPKRQKDVSGFLFMCSIGTDSLLTKKYQAEMRKLCRSFGLKPGLNLYEQGEAKIELDLLAGGYKETP